VVNRNRILIVEDELILAEHWSRLLKEKGYEVVGISDNGEAAIKLALETTPDLALVDIRLRGPMDGIQVADKIRRLHGTAIVYLTAYSDKALFERAKETGPERYLSKPILPMELTRTVELVLLKHEMEIRLRETELRYRTLVEDSFDGIFVQKGSLIAFANNRLHEMLGYDQGELIGKDHWTICHPEYQALVRQRAQARISGESMIDHYEIKLQAKDGTVLDGEIRSKPILLDGKAGVRTWVRNVTSQKRAQEEIELLGEVVRQTHEGIAMVDLAGNLIFLNDAFAKMHGYAPEELKGQNLSVFHTKEQMLEVAAANRFIQETGQFSGEIWHARKGGTVFPTLMHNSLIRDPQGHPAGMIGTVRDISELKRSQEQLRLEKQRFELLVETAPFGLVIIEQDGTFQYINPKFVEMFGYALEEIPNGSTWFRKAFPDLVDRRNAISIWISDARKAKPGEQRPRTFSVVCRDGEKKDILFRPVQLANGQHIVTTEDITERRRAEEALMISELNYRTIFNSIEDAIFVHDFSTGEILDVNAKMCEMYGYSAEEARSLTVEDMSAGDLPYNQKEALRAIREAVPVQPKLLEWKAKKKNGNLFWVEVNLKRCLMNGRDSVLAVVRDITERKRAEEALQESEARFREFAEAVPQAVYELDANGDFAFLNRAGLAMGGYGPEDIDRGMKLTDFVVPEDCARMLENLRRVLLGEVMSANEYTVAAKDGSRMSIATYASPITKADRVVGVRGVCVDIRKLKEAEAVLQRSRSELEQLVVDRTSALSLANEQLRQEIVERSRVQKALAESEARLRGIFETTPDCVFIKDLSFRYSLVNSAMCSLFDLTGGEIVGKTDAEIFEGRTAELLTSGDSRVVEGEVLEELQIFPLKDGLFTFLTIKAPLTDSHGEVVGICGIARNITERKTLVEANLPRTIQFRSAAMSDVLKSAHLAAASDSTILLTGESGTGKDYLARYIHGISRRSGGPYYSINCAAIPSELAESELFGHEKGAFTGATKKKRGLLELAEGGSLLLNEIGDMPFHLQAKLLAFLDSMSFTRVGGENSVSVNVRLIAATNRNLTQGVGEGRFRQDLFYRLDVFSIRLPPLRERIEDIPALFEELLSALAVEFGHSGKVQQRQRIIETLTNYSWPGNIREFRNVLERAVILSKGGSLRPEHFPVFERQPPEDRQLVSVPIDASLPEVLGEIERSLISEALKRSHGNRKKAAQTLGVSRFALARHMEKLGIHNSADNTTTG
jgi:sigma-54 dependent transcriptional regulator, acetoin dehydrogenase operon transcriptional activator AcoR